MPNDAEALADAFRRDGVVQLNPFLEPDDAEILAENLKAREDWRLVINQGDKLFELDRATQAALGAERERALDAAISKQARDGFQFRYETIRVPDAPADRAHDSDPVARLAEAMSEEPFLSFARTLTGAADIAFADAQATLYGPGHFLTAHTDEVAGKARRAAYVLGLTAGWQMDWGGLLLLHETPSRSRAFVPVMNTVTIFAVPQPHSVSLVTPWAARRRMSVTGWLRAGAPG